MEKSQDKPKVSVIVPVYNVEKWLTRCLNSILSQDFDSFEVLLVDDGSTDNSAKVCKAFSSSDSRIKYFYKENGGLSDARNYGIRKAKGTYIVFIDSDDYIKKDYLFSLYNSITKTNSEVAICGFDWVDENDNILYNVSLENIEDRKIISGRELLKDVFKKEGYAFVVAWNKMYKKSIFDNGIIFPKGRLFEDEFINYELFWNVKKVVLIDKRLYAYVQRNGSIKNSKLTLKKISDFNELNILRTSFYKKKNRELYHLANQAYRNWIVSIYYQAFNILSKKSKVDLRQKYIQLIILDKCKSDNRLQDIFAVINLYFASKLKNYLKKKRSE